MMFLYSVTSFVTLESFKLYQTLTSRSMVPRRQSKVSREAYETVFSEGQFLIIFGVRANFLKDFPLELLLGPRCRAKANIRAMTRRAET